MADRHEQHRPGEARAGGESAGRESRRRGPGGRFWGWQPQSVALDMQRTPPPNGWAYSAVLTGVVAAVVTPIPWFIGLVAGTPFALLAVLFGVAGVRKARSFGGIGLRSSAIGLTLGALCLIALPFGAGTVW